MNSLDPAYAGRQALNLMMNLKTMMISNKKENQGNPKITKIMVRTKVGRVGGRRQGIRWKA
jgi:hypothetical protein